MKEVATVSQFSSEQLELMKRTIAQGATSDELALFVNQCKRTGLDPFTRQIYFIKDKQGKVTVCSSIDGLRLVAERSDKYEGQTKAEWCGADGLWKDIWLTDDLPKAARVGVYKTKFREPTYAVAIFDEYAGRYSFDDSYGKFKKGDLTFMWNKMPALMIGKVAEALALRKAFPNDLSGIYSSEEAELIAPTEAPPEPKAAQSEKPKEITAKPVAARIENSAEYVVTFGKFKGMPLKNIQLFEIEGYVQFLQSGSQKQNKPLTGGPLAFVENATAYLSQSELEPTLNNEEIPF